MAGAFAVSACLTLIVRKIAIKRDFVARPVEDRYHRTIIPMGGGIAIFWTIALFVIGGVVGVKLLWSTGIVSWLDESVLIHYDGLMSKIRELVVIIVAAAVLHIMGLWDDRKRLGPGVKLLVQFATAGFAAYFGDVRVEFFIESKIITAGLSAFWIVLIMNAFNFLDNMDGLSAGIAVITSSILFTAAAMSGQVFVGGLALVFIGAVMGFLVFNFPPAKIFMGDCGSLVVGFFVATLTLRTTYYHEGAGGELYAVFMPLVVMAVPLYDFTSVTLLRLSQGKSPFVGDTQHFSHRLKRRGLSDTQTTLTLYLATLCTGISAVFLYQVNIVGAILIFAQTIMILCIVAILEMTGNGGTTNGHQ